jgi:alanine racemase
MYREALSFKSRVAFVKDVPADFIVSYGATYKTSQPTRLATISVGYADGYSRKLSNKGMVLIGPQKYPVVGTVCMDMLVVDVGRDPIHIGDEVTLIGGRADSAITMRELAEQTGSIEYEIMCGIGKRVPRVYVK